nr:centromere protein J [Misgurnus anguillicaudatus]XP_055042632.1 centromere protein J [Misgurnus anguillicaudatus]
MSAEIPQNQTVIENSSSGQQTDPSAKVQTMCPIVQQHRENMQSDRQHQMNESDPSNPSQSLSQEIFEQVSDVGTSQHTQHLMSQRFPKESRGQDELLLQLQVKQLQKVLQEQNALLSLISPGLILSPTFLAHLQAQTPSGFPQTAPVNLTENSPALKENLTKPTLSSKVENGPEGTDVTVNRTQSIEPRILSPIKEERSELGVDNCFCSPFGSRRNVLANPEERPICPGLKEKQKTFEEFVEEHLKVHQPVLQQDDQTCRQITQAQKKDFLRKGEGMSRIVKGKDGSQIIQRRNSLSPQFMNLKSMPQKISSVELHQNGKKNEMPNISCTRRYSLPNVKDLGNLGDRKCDLEDFQRKPIDPQDDHLQKQAYKPLTSSLVDKTNSLKNKHSSEEQGKTNKAMSQKSGLNKPSCPRDVRKVDSFNENVGFKKINDHIVKVKEKSDPATSRLHGRSEFNKELGLSNEVMESLALSDSNDSTSSEDGPISQSHRPLPHFPSRHTDYKDQSLDLSDDDYASDAPSETEIVNEKHRSSTPTSSSSSSSSDSELQSLQVPMTNHFKKTEDQHVQPEGKWPGDTVCDFRPPSRLTKETGQHDFNDGDNHTPVRRHKEDPSEICKTQDLKQQIFSLKQKLMEREVHWSQVHNLLQNRVEALTKENQELSKLSGNGRSQLGSYNTGNTSREDMQRNSGVRSATPAFTKPSVHKKETQRGHLANEHTAISLRKSSACSLDVGNLDSNAMITQGRQGSLFQRNIDCSDAQMTSQSRKDQVKEEIRYPDGRVERLFLNGCRVITFRNGTKKEIGVDRSITVTFFNGDVKHILADGTVIYYYCDAQTTHSTYPSGLEVLQFPNNQREKRYPDGKREIAFPDGTVKILYPDGREESIFSDGTVVRISNHCEKIVEFTNGQREIHTAQYKRRMYPDGTIKTVYTNGRQETKFSSGRVRIKNDEGIVIMDKK